MELTNSESSQTHKLPSVFTGQLIDGLVETVASVEKSENHSSGQTILRNAYHYLVKPLTEGELPYFLGGENRIIKWNATVEALGIIAKANVAAGAQ